MERSPKFFGYVLAFAFLITFLISFLLVTDMIKNGSLYYNGKPLWIGGLLVLFVCFISLVGSIRIFSEKTPIYPLWFSIPFLAIHSIGCFILMLLGEIPWPNWEQAWDTLMQ
jgi:hypothetical protein